MTAVLDAPSAHPAVPVPAAPRPGLPARLPARLLVAGVLVGLAELLGPLGWGWPALLAALVLTAAALPGWGSALLDRVVPAAWLWVAGVVLLGWVAPFLPWLARPGTVVALALLPWLVPGGPWPRWRRGGHGAAVREWTAGLLPAVVLSVPALLHRELASLVTTLSLGWDTPNHLLLLRGALLSPGVTLYGPRPDLLLPADLLDYPSGAHQVWAAGGRLLGLPGAAATDVVTAYPWLVAATWALLGLTAVWTYRRLVPWARHRAGRDAAGLAVLVLALAVAPAPALWWSGFHNLALAAAGLLLLLGLGVRGGGRPAGDLLLSGAALVAVTATYPLLLPAAGLGWLVVVGRAALGGGAAARRRAAVAVILTAAACFPALVPYLSGRGGEALTAAGGLVQVPLAALVVPVALVALAALAWAPYRRRVVRAWAVPTAGLLLVVVVAAVTLRAGGMVGYYADKAVEALIVVLVPLAAAAVTSLALAWSRAGSAGRARLLAGLAVLAVVTAAAVPASARVPRDPLGTQPALAGPAYLAQALASPPVGWTTGERVLAIASWSTASGRAPAWVVPLTSVSGPDALAPVALVAEDHWLDVLVPVDVSSSRLFVSLAGAGAGVDELGCAATVFQRHHPEVSVLVLAPDAAQAAQVRVAAASCRVAGARPLTVGTGTLPPPLPGLREQAVRPSA